MEKTGATHSHLHKAQRKRKWSLPWFASSHFCDRSLESLRRGAPTSSCRASLTPSAPQFGRGFWGSRSSCAAISVRTGWEKAGAPLRVTLGKTLSRFEEEHTHRQSQSRPLTVREQETLTDSLSFQRLEEERAVLPLSTPDIRQSPRQSQLPLSRPFREVPPSVHAPFCSAPRPLQAASHRAPANREMTRHPSPFLSSLRWRGG